MPIRGQRFLSAAGAILRGGGGGPIEGVDLTTVGLILLIVGVVGLLIGLWQTQRVGRAARYDDAPPPPADRRY